MGTSQFSLGMGVCSGGMVQGSVAVARRSSGHIGCRSSSVAFPKPVTTQGPLVRERALFRLEVTAGNQRDSFGIIKPSTQLTTYLTKWGLAKHTSKQATH